MGCSVRSILGRIRTVFVLRKVTNDRYSWGNFKNLKSKQRKQRVRKMATEVFSVVLLFILRLFLFKFSNEYIYSPKCHLVVI